MRRSNGFISMLVVASLVTTLVLGGCVFGKPKLVSLPDSTGAFHILVPENWQHQLASGYIGLYASDSLPKNSNANPLDAPSMIILTTTTTSTTPLPTELTTLIDIRAVGRGWRDKQVGTPLPTKVGGRPGYVSEVSGVDSTGARFQGRFYVARTSGREVFVAALATPEAWKSFSGQVDEVLRDWYWQLTDNTANTPGTDDTTAPGAQSGQGKAKRGK